MKINFRAKYLGYDYIINKDLYIYFFHFFKDNKLLCTKKMIYNLDMHNFCRISKSVLNSLYEKQYKISYVCVIILLTDIYINENQRLIYINAYRDNSFCNFIIGSYYKFLSHDYIHYDTQIYYNCPPRWIGNFYYYNHYITKQEINDVCNRLEIYGNSIKLLYTL